VSMSRIIPHAAHFMSRIWGVRITSQKKRLDINYYDVYGTKMLGLLYAECLTMRPETSKIYLRQQIGETAVDAASATAANSDLSAIA